MLTVIPCPECGAPAEVTERFSLPSTDGAVQHVVLYCAAGHHFRMPADRLPAGQGQHVPPEGLRVLLPHTVRLCVRCLQNPAGFWVSRKDAEVVRRPWCLCCCQRLDRDRCDVISFERLG